MAVTITSPPGDPAVTVPHSLPISAKLQGLRERPCPRSALHVCPWFGYDVGSLEAEFSRRERVDMRGQCVVNRAG